MDIILIPAGGGARFTFPALPERIQGRYGAKYQSFDIISQGAVKVPKGTEVAEFTWDGVFFGESKRNEPIVKRNSWKEPGECVRNLYDFIKNETVLNLIVTETWINMDVTVSSFQPRAAGAYGNIEYSIAFVQKKPLVIYTTNELQIAKFVRKTKPRNDSGGGSSGDGGSGGGGSYTIVSGDTLSGIAARKMGGASKWPQLYDANAGSIEAAAKRYGKSSSDHGHWIYPGEVLTIPG